MLIAKDQQLRLRWRRLWGGSLLSLIRPVCGFMLDKIKRLLIGMPRNPFATGQLQSVALVAFYAWVGLGSDGLSSANYGPEEAFRALHQYPMLGIYLALAMFVSVFIIAGAYNQVIELFPTGGGGYRVSNVLLHPLVGLLSGVALVVDYALTIAISTAAAVDALFSLLPVSWWQHMLGVKLFLVVFLTIINLRGAKESIRVLLPIFLGFVISHFFVLLYGLFAHEAALPAMIDEVFTQSHAVVHNIGWGAALVLLLKAYSLGAGTYTGLEAVSNNVNVLAEPRVKTGKWTMFYMALSLSLMAGGIIFMYMLWGVQAQPHQTYNAVLFSSILGPIAYHHVLVVILLVFEAGILLLGGNTGFLGGPAVLANMAMDRWVPSQFSNLSSRLVKQNGILAFALIALFVMLLTGGHVAFLVVLYSTTVFLTFSISLYALVHHWVKQRAYLSFWVWARKFTVVFFGLVICVSILSIVLVEKFFQGGWLALVIVAVLYFICYVVRNHYIRFSKKVDKIDRLLTAKKLEEPAVIPVMDAAAKTAIIFVNEHPGLGIHTLLWLNRLFPGQFKQFVFIQVGIVDNKTFVGESDLWAMRQSVEKNLDYFVRYAHSLGFAADTFAGYGTNVVPELLELCEQALSQYSDSIFFAGRTIPAKDSFVKSLLHNRTANSLQAKLHLKGQQMILLPVNIRA